MKKQLIFPIFLIFLIFFSGCSSSSKVGGFDISLEKGEYTLKDNNVLGGYVTLEGQVDLKICNNENKILPFIISDNIAKIDIVIKPEYLENKLQGLIPLWKSSKLTSNEGIIEIAPGECPVYTFNFKKDYTAIINNTNRVDLIERKALNEAEIYLNLSNNRIKLNGVKEISLSAEALAKKGLKEPWTEEKKGGYNVQVNHSLSQETINQNNLDKLNRDMKSAIKPNFEDYLDNNYLLKFQSELINISKYNLVSSSSSIAKAYNLSFVTLCFDNSLIQIDGTYIYPKEVIDYVKNENKWNYLYICIYDKDKDYLFKNQDKLPEPIMLDPVNLNSVLG